MEVKPLLKDTMAIHRQSYTAPTPGIVYSQAEFRVLVSRGAPICQGCTAFASGYGISDQEHLETACLSDLEISTLPASCPKLLRHLISSSKDGLDRAYSPGEGSPDFYLLREMRGFCLKMEKTVRYM